MLITSARESLKRIMGEIDAVTDETLQTESAALPYIGQVEPFGTLDSFGKRVYTLQVQKTALFDRAVDMLGKAEENLQTDDDLDELRYTCAGLYVEMLLLRDLLLFTCRILFPKDVGTWLEDEENSVFIGQNFGVYPTKEPSLSTGYLPVENTAPLLN